MERPSRSGYRLLITDYWFLPLLTAYYLPLTAYWLTDHSPLPPHLHILLGLIVDLIEMLEKIFRYRLRLDQDRGLILLGQSRLGPVMGSDYGIFAIHHHQLVVGAHLGIVILDLDPFLI